MPGKHKRSPSTLFIRNLSKHKRANFKAWCTRNFVTMAAVVDYLCGEIGTPGQKIITPGMLTAIREIDSKRRTS